jgi:hypothetical protein
VIKVPLTADSIFSRVEPVAAPNADSWTIGILACGGCACSSKCLGLETQGASMIWWYYWWRRLWCSAAYSRSSEAVSLYSSWASLLTSSSSSLWMYSYWVEEIWTGIGSWANLSLTSIFSKSYSSTSGKTSSFTGSPSVSLFGLSPLVSNSRG